MDPVSGLASSMGGLASGFMSYLGAQEANRSNSQMADASNQFGRESAQIQMNYQERMANSAHQRQIADLKKAGLNPLLSGTGGATSPSGASASSSAATAENVVAPAITSAIEARNLGMALENQKQDLALKKAQTSETAMRTAVLAKDIPKAEILNEAYGVGKKVIQSIKGFIQGSPQHNTDTPYLHKKMHEFTDRQKTIQLKSGKP